MEKQSLNDNIKYPLFCAGRISKKTIYKMYFEVVCIFRYYKIFIRY